MSTDRGYRWLRVQHETHYRYRSPVELAHHVAHLCPRDTVHQRVRNWRLLIDPPPDEWSRTAEAAADASVGVLASGPWTRLEAPLELKADGPLPGQFSMDPWGNRRVAFSHARVHDRLRVKASFEVGVLPARLDDPDAGPSWEAVAESLRYHAGSVHSEAVEFTLPSYFAPRAPQLAAFGREAFTRSLPILAGALALMSLVHRRFEYKPHSTSVATRALEALALSKGVCQDFAHVMIGACRSLGLAARYVSGYLLTQPPPGQPRLVGADASHAWVEVWCPPQGWVALDPTNDVPCGTDHVTLAWGRDYADVAPLRGVIRGGDASAPQVGVTVEPMDEVSVQAPGGAQASPATMSVQDLDAVVPPPGG